MATTTYIRSRYKELMANLPKARKETAAWFQDAMKAVSGHELMSRNRPRLLPQRRLSRRLIGRMIMYFYEPLPQSQATMPYFDTFPLVIPINMYEKGWLGLNLHYLAPRLRVDLLDSLYELYNNQHLDENRKLNISYNTLQKSMKIRFYQPTIHRYRNDRLRSRIYVVDPAEWDFVLLLPTERFVGASKYKVWNDSRRHLGIGKL